VEKLAVQEHFASVKPQFENGSSTTAAEAAFKKLFQMHKAPSEHVIRRCMTVPLIGGTVLT
jgi:hypothetical protein